MDREQEVAEFQGALLELLDSELSTEEMLTRLRLDPVFSIFKHSISSYSPVMVEVAAELVKKRGHQVW